MRSQMARYSQKDADNYDKFIEFSSKVYEAVITQGLGSTPFNKLFTMLEFVPQALKTNAFLPAYYQASRYFENFRHRFMFSFHPLFIGGNPFKVPSIYLMISYLEKKSGVWFTTGGMYSLVKAFGKIIEKHGGKIHTSTPVYKIELKGRRATGVVAKDKFYEADIVISNADVTHTYKDLVPREEIKWNTGKLEKAKYAMSSYVLYLGVKKKYPELKHHTLILSHRYKELVYDIFEKHIIPEDFSMYLHVPSATDSSMAPEGSESIYVLIPVSNLKANVDWKTFDAEFTEKVINFLEHNFGMKDLAANIEVKKTFNPLDFKNVRNSYLGTPWGMEPVLQQSAYFRAHNLSEDFENLFLVGAGTHPGAGLPGVMLSSAATFKLINEYKK
jgi:phytoene desaturase